MMSGKNSNGTDVVPFSVASEEGKASKPEAEEQEAPLPPAPAQPELSPAEQYCSNVIDAASGAQIAQQTSKLEKAQKELDARIALLAEKTEVLKGWVKTRQEFTARATESLVQIYSKMKPEAAAGQLTAMNELVAAAIMSKLSPKISSLLLAEMEAGKAARLSAVIAGAGEIKIKPERKADAQQ